MPWKLYQPKRQRGASGIHWPWKTTEYSQHHRRKEKVGEVALWYCGCPCFANIHIDWLHCLILFCYSMQLLHTLREYYMHSVGACHCCTFGNTTSTCRGHPEDFATFTIKWFKPRIPVIFVFFLDPLRIKPTGRISPPVRRRQIGNHWCRKGVVPRFLNGRKSCHAFQQSPRAAVRESQFINWISPGFFPMLESWGAIKNKLMCLSEGLTGSRAHPAVSLMGFECHWGCLGFHLPRPSRWSHWIPSPWPQCWWRAMRLVWRWAGDLRLKNMGWGKLRGFFSDLPGCREVWWNKWYKSFCIWK